MFDSNTLRMHHKDITKESEGEKTDTHTNNYSLQTIFVIESKKNLFSIPSLQNNTKCIPFVPKLRSMFECKFVLMPKSVSFIYYTNIQIQKYKFTKNSKLLETQISL